MAMILNNQEVDEKKMHEIKNVMSIIMTKGLTNYACSNDYLLDKDIYYMTEI